MIICCRGCSPLIFYKPCRESAGIRVGEHEKGKGKGPGDGGRREENDGENEERERERGKGLRED